MFWAACRKRFFSGMLIAMPLFITILVFRFLYNFTNGLFLPVMRQFFPEMPTWVKFIFSCAVLIFTIYLLGLVTGHFVGRWFWNRFEKMLLQIPLLRTIYSASRDVVHMFHNPGKPGFKEVVLVEFPRPGLKAVGFITGSIADENGYLCYKVFIPTTPNPTSGFLEILPPSAVIRTDISVEEGIKMIVSGGILGPETVIRKTTVNQ
jgi:uncharacterized membrane protein